MCEATAELFVRTLIDRFFRKLEDVDGKQLLRNFVHDLLLAYGLPEWPSSELLLFFFAKQFVSCAGRKYCQIVLVCRFVSVLGWVSKCVGGLRGREGDGAARLVTV